MSCKCASVTDEYHGWECSVTGGACVYLIPDSKACARDYGEGPDAKHNKCEDCKQFYYEEGKRCCKVEPLRFDTNKPSKYLEDSLACCGGWEAKD